MHEDQEKESRVLSPFSPCVCVHIIQLQSVCRSLQLIMSKQRTGLLFVHSGKTKFVSFSACLCLVSSHLRVSSQPECGCLSIGSSFCVLSTYSCPGSLFHAISSSLHASQCNLVFNSFILRRRRQESDSGGNQDLDRKRRDPDSQMCTRLGRKYPHRLQSTTGCR